MGIGEKKEPAAKGQVRNIDGVVARPGQAARPAKKPLRFKNKIVYCVIITILVAAFFAGWYFLLSPDGKINHSRYQAVFLANGQVYFGKLSGLNGRYAVLTDVYYLQSDNKDTVQQTTGTDTAKPPTDSMQLIKLGEELHGPEDQMQISREQILFWENLKDGGGVVEAIQNYQKKQQ